MSEGGQTPPPPPTSEELQTQIAELQSQNKVLSDELARRDAAAGKTASVAAQGVWWGTKVLFGRQVETSARELESAWERHKKGEGELPVSEALSWALAVAMAWRKYAVGLAVLGAVLSAFPAWLLWRQNSLFMIQNIKVQEQTTQMRTQNEKLVEQITLQREQMARQQRQFAVDAKRAAIEVLTYQGPCPPGT